MDKRSLIGLVLIFVLFYIWAQMQMPTQAELAEKRRLQDSIEQVNQVQDTEDIARVPIGDSTMRDTTFAKGDTSQAVQSTIPVETYTIENEKLRILFSNKGGKIISVLLKGYKSVKVGKGDSSIMAPLHLLDDKRNKWQYIIPQGVGMQPVRTSDLIFRASQSEDGITFTAILPNGGTFIQEYRFGGEYVLDYNFKIENASGLRSGDMLTLVWENYLPSLEKNRSYEKYYATIYYKLKEEDPTYVSSTSENSKTLTKPVKWVGHSNQFFNSTLISDEYFNQSTLVVNPMPEQDSSILLAKTKLDFQIKNPASGRYSMQFYIGPNDFERLQTIGHDVSDIVYLGWGIFGTINRWIIRPLFNFLLGFIGSKGLVIIILTILVKLALYPLTYKMLKSQTMMGGLKPQIQKVRDKFKDDSQKAQVETMKLYREYGVSPLGGCLPMLLQMPIWFALYRFFPAYLKFRQAGFLWASDLSSYDAFFHLPFHIPFYGSHVSLFTLLWSLSLFGYTYYNMKYNMNGMQAGGGMGGANMEMMKYMQYLMPVMFLFFLNSYASGLTCYLLFSNLTNIAQTVVTKNYILHDEKIQKKLASNKEKKKNKPKSKFQKRIEEIMEEQNKRKNDQ